MMAARGRSELLIPTLLALAALTVLLGLGTWQLNRKAWKEVLIQTMNDRLSAAPVELPSPEKWNLLTPDNSDFTRVKLHAEFSGAGDALSFTSGSLLRDDVKGIGYFVFSPARLPGGAQVVVNRGFVSGRTYPAAPGAQDIVGYIRWPEAPPWFVSNHDAAGEVWTVRDPRLMAQVRGWGAVAPFYVEQEAPVPPGGLPHPAALKVQLHNDHLQYAITWYGLAAVLVVMFGIWAMRCRRDSEIV